MSRLLPSRVSSAKPLSSGWLLWTSRSSAKKTSKNTLYINKSVQVPKPKYTRYKKRTIMQPLLSGKPLHKSRREKTQAKKIPRKSMPSRSLWGKNSTRGTSQRSCSWWTKYSFSALSGTVATQSSYSRFTRVTDTLIFFSNIRRVGHLVICSKNRLRSVRKTHGWLLHSFFLLWISWSARKLSIEIWSLRIYCFTQTVRGSLTSELPISDSHVLLTLVSGQRTLMMKLSVAPQAI